MTVPAPDLRDRLAEELAGHWPTDRRDADGFLCCSCGRWYAEENVTRHHADAVLGIVQERMDAVQQGNVELDASVTELREGLVIARRTNDFGRSQLEEARDLMSNAGHNRAHLDDWPDIIPALQDLIAERDQARATIRRLNYRCQQHESKIAAFVRLVSAWRLGEKGTYVPLRNLTAIAKLAGREIDGDRYQLHYQRVDALEAAVTKAARILLQATADRASSRTALLQTAPPVCGEQLTDWTCTLPTGPHPDWRHGDGEHWWTQTRCPGDCGQPNTAHHCTPEV